jgi:AcrR family transcriptional regulator
VTTPLITPVPAGTRRRAAALPPDVRRSMIVQATLPLLLEHGDMVTTRQIADAAGIAEGTIFRAFPDKDALITAVLEAAYDPAPLDRALADIDSGLSFEATLCTMVELIQKRAIDLWRIASSVGTRFSTVNRPISTSEPMVAFMKRHRDRLRIPPQEASRLLRALTVSLTHPALADEPMAPKRIVNLFLNGAGAA